MTAHRAEGLPQRPSAALAVVAAAGMLVLGAIRIGRSFGYDEGYTYFFFINGGSVRRALTTQIVFNNHPTFSATQAIGWRLGLVGETTQRLGPVVCAAATVGLLVWYTARRCGVYGGLAAGVTTSGASAAFSSPKRIGTLHGWRGSFPPCGACSSKTATARPGSRW